MAVKLALAVSRGLLRSSSGPLRPLWAAGYRALARGIVGYLRRGTGAAAFVRGSGLSSDQVFGLSDLDLILVTRAGAPPRDRALIASRRRRLGRWLGSLRAQVDVSLYDEPELASVRGATTLTYGLESAIPAALRADPNAPHDEAGLLLRPDAARGWRPLAGHSPHSVTVTLPSPQAPVAAWLELQSWWRHAFRLCSAPDRPDSALLALKLFAEPARILLWTVHGRVAPSREEVLREAARSLPEEEAALRDALALMRGLPSSPAAPVEVALGYLLRMSGRIARLIEQQAEGAGTRTVELVGVGSLLALPEGADTGGERALPLVDWRACAGPDLPDDAFVSEPGYRGDPAAVASAAAREGGGVYRVLCGEGVAVLPTRRPWPRGVMRAVQCPASDPVLFALLARRGEASFPELPGWSARDTARRAVAEHRAWIATQPTGGLRTLTALGLLLKAARAALLLETFEQGAPRLALTVSATAQLAGERGEVLAQATAEACDAFLACRRSGRAPQEKPVLRLDLAVRSMPSYSKGSAAGAHVR